MRKEYDFSKACKNPYASMLKKAITIRLDEDSVSYFKSVSEEVGIPYQRRILVMELGYRREVYR
jgi:hypothetical protein